jgi:NDP-sugar pyrophosphorylase family protein
MSAKEGAINHEKISCAEVVGIALCGGQGKRLAGVTRGEIPKPLVKINGISLIDYSLKPLYTSGVRRFILAVSSYSEQIVNHVSRIQSELRELQAFFSYEESPAGIALGVRQALETFNVKTAVVVFDTDAIRLGLDFQDAYRFHRVNDSITTLVCARVPTLKDSHFAVFNDKTSETALVVLKPDSISLPDTVIKCGMMICSPRATRFIRESEDIPNSWIGLVEHLSLLGRMKTYIIPKFLVYSNVNTPEELKEAERLLISYKW